MIADGIYRVYSMRHGDNGHAREFMGRFSLMNGAIHVLEDHSEDSLFHSVITDGVVDARTAERLERLVHSPNIELVSEADAHAGLDEIPDAPKSDILPSETLDVVEQNGNRHVLEVYGDRDLRMDGKSLSADERKLLTEKLKTGYFVAQHRS